MLSTMLFQPTEYKNLAFFPNTKIHEEYINTSSEKHFHDCYHYSSQENIKNYIFKLRFDIDSKDEIDTSFLKKTLLYILFMKKFSRNYFNTIIKQFDQMIFLF